MKQLTTWIIVITVIIIAIGVILFSPKKGETPVDEQALTSRDIALTCTTHTATGYHIHPELAIIIHGEERVLPANIGVDPVCMKSIHTHDASGTIHIEAPEKRDFTLGDFFAVWEQPFSQTQFMEFTADTTNAIVVTVNGKEVDTYENTLLEDKDKIVIEVKKS